MKGHIMNLICFTERGRHELGIYSVAVRVAELWYFMPTAIISSVFPALITAKQEGEIKYKQRLQLLYCAMTWMGVTVAMIMTLLASPVINLLYGDQYIEAGSILAINIWAGIFVFQGVARHKWMLIERLQNYSLIFFAIGLIVNVILNVLLIPSLKAKGAAYAALASQFTVAIIAPMLFTKTRISSIMLLKSFLPVNELTMLGRQLHAKWISENT